MPVCANSAMYSYTDQARGLRLLLRLQPPPPPLQTLQNMCSEMHFGALLGKPGEIKFGKKYKHYQCAELDEC